jgi:hypothetical protein
VNSRPARLLSDATAADYMIGGLPTISSDPHAWLRPIYSRLRADRSFRFLASNIGAYAESRPSAWLPHVYQVASVLSVRKLLLKAQ